MRRYPPGTLLIIALNIVYFALEMFTDPGLSFVTLVDLGAKVNFRITDGYLWHLVTPVFMHGSLSHLAFNSFAILMFAPIVEERYGTKKFLLIYVAMGTLATIGSYTFSNQPSLGASGAIWGLMAFHIYLFIVHRELYQKTFGNSIFILLAINIAYSLYDPQIDYFGHFVGFFGGLSIFFLTNPKWNKRFPSKALGVFLLVLILGLGGYKFMTYHHSKDYFMEKMYYYQQKADETALIRVYEDYLKYFPPMQ